VLYLGGVVLIGALAAPPLFRLGHAHLTHKIVPGLAHIDFESYFHRALLIAAVLLLWPLLRWLRVRRWRDLALEENARGGPDVAAGFVIAMFPLLCCGCALIALHIYSLRPAFLWHKMPAVLIATSIVPIVEELFFRGLILGVLLRSFSRIAAAVITAAFFSIIHFLKAPRLTTPNDAVNWFSGFVSIGHSFWQFADPLLLAAGFLTLFVVGCVLADARLRTHSLWLPIGLHAGWLFASGSFSKAAHRETLALPWIGKDLLIGIVPLMIALASWALMRAWVRYACDRHAQSAPRVR
jgi:uncharacterized protein